MTLQDILNSNLSDSHKIEIITWLQKGGLTPDQEAGREPVKEDGKEYYVNGDGEKIPAERLEKHPELKGQNTGKTITPTETILIGDQEFDVAIADTPEARREGLEPYGYLKPDEGMLFIFEEEVTEPFTMANCAIDLDIIFIDSEGEVISVHPTKAYDEEPVICKWPYMYVLEVNINSGIKRGDELDQESEEYSDDEKEELQKNRMLVLDSNGDVQMKLQGHERIFSRISTRRMIKAALKAYKTDADVDYRRVGRIVLKELDAQDGRDAEYVQLPE